MDTEGDREVVEEAEEEEEDDGIEPKVSEEDSNNEDDEDNNADEIGDGGEEAGYDRENQDGNESEVEQVEGNDSEKEDGEDRSIIMKLSKELFIGRLKLAGLKRKRRLLLEELHRHCLEGEIDPKKRTKVPMEKLKKSKISLLVPNLEDNNSNQII